MEGLRVVLCEEPGWHKRFFVVGIAAGSIVAQYCDSLERSDLEPIRANSIRYSAVVDVVLLFCGVV